MKGIESYFPVGINYTRELRWIRNGLLVSLLWSFGFLWRLGDAYNALFQRGGVHPLMRQDAVMPDFVELLEFSLFGFVLCGLCAAVLLSHHYSYHFQGSKSIYLMKRLPQRGELLRRCIAVPAALAAIAVLCGALLLFGYFELYHRIVPEPCLVPGQWDILWNTYF